MARPPSACWVTTKFPSADTVAAWQVAHEARVVDPAWAAVLGGAPWQVPQVSASPEVQLNVVTREGEVSIAASVPPPWQYTLEQVAVATA